MTTLLDALELDSAHMVGNSMGGRVALELGLRDASRVGGSCMLAPSMAWLKRTPVGAVPAPDPTQLGIFQPTPRPSSK